MVMVLLVDNDIAQLTSNANALLTAGHQVCTALSGEEALEELDWDQPDALVCSSSMPGVDGWDLVWQVRGDDRYRSIPILLMGTADDKEVRLAAFRNGVDDYLPKPFEPEELVRRLDRTLGRSRIVDRPITSPPPCDVQGRLQNFPLSTVLRLLANERKTGTLLVQQAGERARFSFREGKILRAEALHEPRLSWQQCLLRALSWSFGDFWFAAQPVGGETEIHLSVDELLDNGLDRGQFGRRA